ASPGAVLCSGRVTRAARSRTTSRRRHAPASDGGRHRVRPAGAPPGLPRAIRGAVWPL
ncbi:MAG: hypothetical protein AVDCRST_MAG77-4714, partial [uncultured Chloroflexi bacterium]